MQTQLGGVFIEFVGIYFFLYDSLGLQMRVGRYRQGFDGIGFICFLVFSVECRLYLGIWQSIGKIGLFFQLFLFITRLRFVWFQENLDVFQLCQEYNFWSLFLFREANAVFIYLEIIMIFSWLISFFFEEFCFKSTIDVYKLGLGTCEDLVV